MGQQGMSRAGRPPLRRQWRPLLVALVLTLGLAAAGHAASSRPWAGRSYAGRLGDYFNNAPKWTRELTGRSRLRASRTGATVSFYGTYSYYCGAGNSHLSAPALKVSGAGRFRATAHSVRRVAGKVTGTNYFLVEGRFVNHGRAVSVSYLDDFVYAGKHVAHPYATTYHAASVACESWVHGTVPRMMPGGGPSAASAPSLIGGPRQARLPAGVTAFPGRVLGLEGLACESASRCLATGGMNGGGGFVTIDRGRPGVPRIVPGVDLQAIACVATACQAVGQDAKQRGVTVSITGKTPHAVRTVGHNVYVLGTVACETATTCQAGGADQGALVGIHGGLPTSVQILRRFAFVDQIACPSATVCWAVGDDPTRGVLTKLVDGIPQAARYAPGGTAFSSIACATASLCEAVGGFAAPHPHRGMVVAITHGAFGRVHTISGTGYLSDVACPTSRTCLAIGNTPVHAGHAAGVALPIVGGRPGTVRRLAELPNRLACPTRSSCEAIGNLPTKPGRGFVMRLRAP